jgi:hypothetical protein
VYQYPHLVICQDVSFRALSRLSLVTRSLINENRVRQEQVDICSTGGNLRHLVAAHLSADDRWRRSAAHPRLDLLNHSLQKATTFGITGSTRPFILKLSALTDDMDHGTKPVRDCPLSNMWAMITRIPISPAGFP